jgi:hypothetical protein
MKLCNRSAGRSLVGPRKEVSMATALSESWKPQERGYHAVYREHEINHCPGCGRTHWIIGRMSAECAFCTTALPLAEASMRSHNAPVIIQHKNRDSHHHAWAA